MSGLFGGNSSDPPVDTSGDSSNTSPDYGAIVAPMMYMMQQSMQQMAYQQQSMQEGMYYMLAQAPGTTAVDTVDWDTKDKALAAKAREDVTTEVLKKRGRASTVNQSLLADDPSLVTSVLTGKTK
jgi:hypothetical protein